MKKTICKTIHKLNNSSFIPLDDIVSVNIKKLPITGYFLLIIELKGNKNIYSRKFISEDAVNITKDNIIKELEEYYGC